ncbi:MAG: hypothetical protein VX498_08865 [Myxococcota bacterium]|nr:hypothetical protein [Myxococcota bacterium]
MSQDRDTDPLLLAWSEALPAVLALLEAPQRDLFRHEIQRFCALARFGSEEVATSAEALSKMLLEAARAAAQPAAIHAGREAGGNPQRIGALCGQILEQWLDAVQSAEGSRKQACDPKGMGGGVFFGPRLGGEGRPGAVGHGRDEGS